MAIFNLLLFCTIAAVVQFLLGLLGSSLVLNKRDSKQTSAGPKGQSLRLRLGTSQFAYLLILHPASTFLTCLKFHAVA